MLNQNRSPHQYDLHRARSPPQVSAVRSPVNDRAPPVRLLDPRTNRIVNVKVSRTTTTAAALQNGATLCRDFLDRSGCQAGAYCQLVHVVGKEHIWEPITPTVSAHGTYVSGFTVNCYDAHMVKYLSIPSEVVIPTAGSGNYISIFNDNGENFKARFQVCKEFLETSACSQSGSCSDIHTIIKDFRNLHGRETHVCDDDVLPLYRRLPSDVTVRVYQQNSAEDFHDFPGDQVLLTQGAQQYLDAFASEGRQIPRKKMQHCAHFRLKRLCRVGADCKFIHVVLSDGSVAAPLSSAADEDMEFDSAIASQTSMPPRESYRSGLESPIGEVNVIVRERARGSGYKSPVSIELLEGTNSPPLAPQVKAKTMGPADIAAMLALRMSNGVPHPAPVTMSSGGNTTPPSTRVALSDAQPKCVSPSRANNPYQHTTPSAPTQQQPPPPQQHIFHQQLHPAQCQRQHLPVQPHPVSTGHPELFQPHTSSYAFSAPSVTQQHLATQHHGGHSVSYPSHQQYFPNAYDMFQQPPPAQPHQVAPYPQSTYSHSNYLQSPLPAPGYHPGNHLHQYHSPQQQAHFTQTHTAPAAPLAYTQHPASIGLPQAMHHSGHQAHWSSNGSFGR